MIEDGVQLITLLGLSGIGKTTLSLYLIDEIKSNFDYIIYHGLSFAPTLDETLTNLLEIFCNQPYRSPNRPLRYDADRWRLRHRTPSN